MKSNKTRLAVAISLSLIATSSYSAEKTIDIEKKENLDNQKNRYSEALYVSANGNTVLGQITGGEDRRSLFRWTKSTGIVGLGTLRSDNSGSATTNGMSRDGSVIVGYSDTDDSWGNAFRWTEKTGMVTLNGDMHSYAQAVSDNGKIISGQMSPGNGLINSTAFIWTEETGMRSLGTLREDNLGTSDTNGMSADGSTIVGDSSTDSGATNAFRWTEKTGMVGLGTLKTDQSGNSFANGASANGSAVVGSSDTDKSEENAFRWTEKTGMVGLGTLRTDNSGSSDADFLSADGSVVIGSAETDYDDVQQAFRWTEKTGILSLGSLKADKSGNSEVLSMTADASVIVGGSYTDNDDYNAFRWTEKTGMVGLGTLRADNSGVSTAYDVSADGLVVVGDASTDDGDIHAALWKIKGSATNPDVVIIDRDNSNTAMSRTAKRGFEVLDFYQSSLDNLTHSRCQLGQDDYCVGLFTQYDNLRDNNRFATGLYSALRLPAENWTVGAAINFANNTTLVDNYDTRGNNRPAVGLFTRYQQNSNNDGLYADLSASYLSQGLRITRDALKNTEAGEGNATVKGYQARLSVGYGMPMTAQTQLLPEIALVHKKINRSRYTETKNAEFPAQYDRMGNKRTDLEFGLNIKHDINEMFRLDGKIGTNIKLSSDRDAFVGYIPYVGAYSYDNGAERTVNPYALAGLNINITKNSTVRTFVSWQQTDYKHDSAHAGLSYSYHW